jgi:hypothetical protein
LRLWEAGRKWIKQIWGLKDKGNFLKACREFGEEIAHKGDNLFVTSDGSLIN